MVNVSLFEEMQKAALEAFLDSGSINNTTVMSTASECIAVQALIPTALVSVLRSIIAVRLFPRID